MRKYLFPLVVLSVTSAQLGAEEAEPYSWESELTLESITNLQGGVKTGTRNLANLDLALTIDTAAADWWAEGNFFVYVLGTYGRPPSALTGELQTLSNIEADNNLTLYEFWYQHSFWDGAVKLLAGLHDYNSTFYSLESSGLFNLSALGIGPDTSQVGPSIFPTTAAAVHLTLTHDDQYFLLATYDGIPGDPAHPHGTHIVFKKSDGLLIAAEWGFASEGTYKIALGTWQHTAQVENPVDGSLSDFNKGYYLIGEKYFTDNLAAFFQYGRADAHKNQLENYTGMGVTYTNLMVDDDAVGLGYARAKNSVDFLRKTPDLLSAETAMELTYYRPLSEKVQIQASLYSVTHPSMEPDLDRSLAVGLRLYIEL